MNKDQAATKIYEKEFQLLNKLNEIEKNQALSKDELLKEFAQLKKEYRKLLRQAVKITRIGDANQRKLMRLWELEQEKLQLAQIVEKRSNEIEEKNRQLQEQSEKLKELDKVKSRFFANISHEFRTPLTLIMGPLDQMASTCQDKEERKNINMMLRSSRRLLNLVNQLLDLSRFESGKMRLQVSRQNIVPFLKGIVNSFDSLTVQNELELAFLCREEEITLFYDAEKIEKAVCNLLINAVKFTPKGGEISVILKVIHKPAPGFLEIAVRDTGIGIPADKIGHIFDRFYQVEDRTGYAQKGTGIGLALAKELVGLHHGKITARSEEGKGSEFVICLPLGDEHLKPEDIRTQPLTTAEYKGGFFEKSPPLTPQKTFVDFESTQSVEEYEAAKSSPSHGEAKSLVDLKGEVEVEGESEHEPGRAGKEDKDIILIVEDNADVREYIRAPLASLYRIVEAKDGEEGTRKARQIIPDLIISDVMMPEVDGFELCSLLKQDVNTSHIPIILLTAKSSEESIISGLATGADDYITKPFNTKILLARIENLIDLRRQLHQNIQRDLTLQPTEISVTSIDKEFLHELQQMIEDNLSDPEFNVDQLGKKLFMSKSSLYRKTQALTGETPNEFLRSYRLKRAAQFLKARFGNITEVALEVGFSNLSYFSRCFKEKFNQLPSDYLVVEAE